MQTSKQTPIFPSSSRKKIFVANSTREFLQTPSTFSNPEKLFWRWGDDNLFPYALSLMSRLSTTHRRVLNDKADYISGKGFSFDPACKPLAELIHSVNGHNESLRQLLNKVAFDKCLFGNAFVEVVSDADFSFLSLFHQDATRCRVAKDRNHILLHHDWSHFNPREALSLPIYPAFEPCQDGTVRSVIHYKDYEPMFENYGVPPYIAGLDVSTIAYKTDKWNISRLDNSFQLSGVMVLNGEVDNEGQAQEIIQAAERKFAGKPGQIMFLVKGEGDTDASKFIPITSDNEGDWESLHNQATTDIVVAHSWFRSLSGLDYQSGFSAERILHEYEIALNTVILAEQEELLEPIRDVLQKIAHVDTATLQIVNRPPARVKPTYMRVWEARKADGMEYDPADPAQQLYLAQLASCKAGTQLNPA